MAYEKVNTPPWIQNPMKQKIKAKQRLNAHPALQAMREAHASYLQDQGGIENVASLYISDFEKHDQNALQYVQSTKANDPTWSKAFGWILGSYGTHLKHVGVPTDAYEQLRARSIKSWPAMVAECYAPDAAIRFFLWDGCSLIRAQSAKHLTELMLNECRRLVLDHLQTKREPISDELAYAGPGEGVWRQRLQAQLAEIDHEIERLSSGEA